MFETIQKFAEIRKLDRLSLVRDFNLFPTSENLLVLERKYGDSLTYLDLYGVKQKKIKRAKIEGEFNLPDDGTTDYKTEAKTTYT